MLEESEENGYRCYCPAQSALPADPGGDDNGGAAILAPTLTGDTSGAALPKPDLILKEKKDCFLSQTRLKEPEEIQTEIKEGMTISTSQVDGLYAGYSWPDTILPVVDGLLMDSVLDGNNPQTIVNLQEYYLTCCFIYRAL